MSALPKHIEDIHPSLWRANQLARQHGRTVDTGYERLSAELPGGGWPVGSLVELLIQQPGIGEVRMLQPALTAVAKRPIVLVKPPHVPNAVGFAYTGIPLANLMLLNTQSSADLLWSAEQILKTGSCGALLLWQQHMRADSLRRLSLNAQASETLLFVMRPLAARQDASPAALRLAIRPTADGVSIDIVKRKGPIGVEPFDLVLKHSPVLLNPYGRTSKSARKIEPVASPMTVSTAG